MVTLAMSRAVAPARLPIPQGTRPGPPGKGILLVRRAGEQDQAVWWYEGVGVPFRDHRGTRLDVRAYYDVPPSGWSTTETFSAWVTHTGGKLRTTQGAGALRTLPRARPTTTDQGPDPGNRAGLPVAPVGRHQGPCPASPASWTQWTWYGWRAIRLWRVAWSDVAGHVHPIGVVGSRLAGSLLPARAR
jgi:hypothetical protein